MKHQTRTALQSLAGLTVLLTGIAAAFSGGGCAVESTDDTSAADEPLLSRTVVHFAEDGTYTVQESMISFSEQQAEIAGRLALEQAGSDGIGQARSAITVDGSCTSAANLYFDQIHGVAANEICFTGTGQVDLSTFCRGSGCSSHWDNAIKSYIGQATNGHVNTGSPGGDCTDFSTTSGQVDKTLNGPLLTQGSSCCTGTQKWCFCSVCPELSHCMNQSQQDACFNWCVNVCG